MPSYIIKPKPDEDFYVTYSTVVDSPTDYGKRFEYIQNGEHSDRLDRADETGTSMHLGWFGWDDKTFTVREGVTDATRPDNALWGTVPRANLRAFCETLGDDGYFHPTAGMVTWVTKDDDR